MRSRLNSALHRARAETPIAARRSGLSRSSPTTAAIEATESGTITPVRPSHSTVVAPGTGVDTAGIPLNPASISTPGMPSPVGRLVNTNTSERRRSSGTSERGPRRSTPWVAAKGASVWASGPSPTMTALTGRPSARSRPTTSMNRSGCFWGVSAPTNMSVASTASAESDRGRNSKGSRPFGIMTAFCGSTWNALCTRRAPHHRRRRRAPYGP